MRVAEPAEGFLLRIDQVAERFEKQAEISPAPQGLTAPDQPSGEQWEWGQVWAHVAEFVPYWMRQIKSIVEADSDAPVPFGRVKTDSGRAAAIESDRRTPPEELMARLSSQLRDLRVMVTDLTPEDWSRRAAHPTRGDMTIERIVDEFLVGHLEEHAAQLDGLVGAAGK